MDICPSPPPSRQSDLWSSSFLQYLHIYMADPATDGLSGGKPTYMRSRNTLTTDVGATSRLPFLIDKRVFTRL